MKLNKQRKASNFYTIFLSVILLFSISITSCKKDVMEIATLEGVAIKNAPSKVTYYPGDLLDLSGLIVTLSYSDNSLETFLYSDFAANGLEVSIATGTVLDINHSEVKITHTKSKKYCIQAITVSVSGSLIDSRDGQVYKTVVIGDQVWMAENLDYAPTDGSIPHVTTQVDWEALDYNDAAYCYYDNDSSLGYGCLYTWSAAMGSSSSSDSNPSGVKGICPSGWHLPSDSEWTELENYLISNGYSYDGSTSSNEIAKSMASKIGWNSFDYTGAIGNNSSTNNSSGFSALPRGCRFNNGSFLYAGNYENWWSSTQNDSNIAYYRYLIYNSQYLYRYDYYKTYGFSVRCLRN